MYAFKLDAYRKVKIYLSLTLYRQWLQYILRNMHTVFALLCFVVVIHWLIFPYPAGLLHWHCGNLTIAPVPAKQPWWIWINTSCEFIMNDCITTTKQSTTKPCAYFLGYTVLLPPTYAFKLDAYRKVEIYPSLPLYRQWLHASKNEPGHTLEVKKNNPSDADTAIFQEK